MPYNPALVAPMRAEVTRLGVRGLNTAEEVDAALGDQRGTMLVFVNSVCGCSAGNARPALALALKHSVVPQQVVTVFAGQDLDAVRLAGADGQAAALAVVLFVAVIPIMVINIRSLRRQGIGQ